MKEKLLLSILLFGTLLQSNAQNIQQIMKSRPVDFEYLSTADSLGVKRKIQQPILTSKNAQAQLQNLPYPIIFIHGLNSNSKTWGDMATFLTNYGLTNGGKLNYCLNQDGSNYTSNLNFYPTPNADIAIYSSNNFSIGDFYELNFDVSNTGVLYASEISDLELSNESAIAKQGVALKDAIQRIMNLTNRDKVILMGHSMGGLASREYLQNPENWTEPYINHHVAKLVTTGTPHGGFTGTNNQLLTHIDSQSEAYRDLRKTYSLTVQDGVYLFGGYENSSVIKNIKLYPFYNVDVNCNGVDEDNTYVVGLNNKQWVTDVDYAYIVGVCTNCGILQGLIEGDGIVRSENANLSNFTTQLPTHKNEFIYKASANNVLIGLHSDLPHAIGVNMQSLDEPNEYDLAYGIDYEKFYTGFITEQPNGGYSHDFDDYTFNVESTMDIGVNIKDIALPDLTARILDSNKNTVITINSNGATSILFSQILTAGKYYLEIYGTPTTTSYLRPYSFALGFSTLLNANFENNNSLAVSPNPTTSKVFFDNSKYNFESASILNYIGQEISKVNFSSFTNNQDIDLSLLSSEVYILKMNNKEITKTIKIIKQ